MIKRFGTRSGKLAACIHARSISRGRGGIAKILDNHATFALIARAARKGFVIAWAAAGDAEILTVAVVPEARRAEA
jgi:ribosomal protein S18 acetylase RimI-like enzyme